MHDSLINKVRNYYFAHFDELDEAHQFHFASRLASWNGDPQALELLPSACAYLSRPGDNEGFTAYFRQVIAEPQTGRRIAHELRAPYFEKYPDLYGVEKAIFRVRHLKYTCGLDVTDDFFAAYPPEELTVLKTALANDPQALAILSSFAVNLFYESEYAVGHTTPHIAPQVWYDTANNLDENEKESIQLLIYLYTHCIIGATNFYVQNVDGSDAPVYLTMLQRLEPLIERHFQSISLDNKLEFLVAAQILQYTSTIADRIYDECQQSLSSDGDFIIDLHNSGTGNNRTSFQKSEHRNVLLIMSRRPFRPFDRFTKL